MFIRTAFYWLHCHWYFGFCYAGHTWKAENIPAWQALERIASDNRMTVEVDEKGVQLMPSPVDGKPVALRLLEE